MPPSIERIKFVSECIQRNKGIIQQLLAAYQQVRKDDALSCATNLISDDLASWPDLTVPDVQTWINFIRGFDLILAAKDIATYDALAAQTRQVALTMYGANRSLSSIFHKMDR